MNFQVCHLCTCGPQTVQGKRAILFIGITCGLSVSDMNGVWVRRQLHLCMDTRHQPSHHFYYLDPPFHISSLLFPLFSNFSSPFPILFFFFLPFPFFSFRHHLWLASWTTVYNTENAILQYCWGSTRKHCECAGQR